ncbi:MAG: 2-oxo acid dehydrogenase subunit E2 [Candidatus Riflebacteria bacterium]|nr:2-oxo acid dehydrogenase subunit E2 [Candidatus Riflebacteria bacterium]
MPYKFEKLGSDRYLVWDLLRETDPYYLNHHLFDVDFSRIENIRIKRKNEGKSVPSYVSLAMTAYAKALYQFPRLNSYLRLYPFTRLAIYQDVDISFTVERDWLGKRIVLLAVLPTAQNLSFDEVHEFLKKRHSAPLEELDEFARYKRLLKIPVFLRWRLFQLFIKPFPELLRQLVGTTAFTSIGRFGTTLTTPLSPRTCTMSLGKVEMRPRYVKGSIEGRLSAWLTLTYDHRVSDGAEIARMGDWLKNLIENELA